MTVPQQAPRAAAERTSKQRCSNHRLFSKMFGDSHLEGSVPDGEDDFHVHRKMLRRRYIRKEQKEKALLEELRRQEERLSFAGQLQSHSSAGTSNQSTNSFRYDAADRASPEAPVSVDATPSRPHNRSCPTLITFSCGNGTPQVQNIIVPPYSPLRSRKFRTLRF